MTGLYQDEQATIVRGEDRVLILKVRRKKDGEPFDLTDVTKITAEFRTANNSVVQKISDPVGGVAASGTHDAVTFTADNTGTDGNTISLVFNGADDIDTVVTAWNGANPTNTVSHDGTGTDVLTSTTLNLTGGVDAETFVSKLSPNVLGKVQVTLSEEDTNSLRLGKNQSCRLFLDKGTHPDGERRIALFRNRIHVVNSNL